MRGCWAQDGARWMSGASAGQVGHVLAKGDRGVQRVPDQTQCRVVHGISHLARSLVLVVGRVRGLGHGLLLGRRLVSFGLGRIFCRRLRFSLLRCLGLGLLRLWRLLLLRVGPPLARGLLLLGRGTPSPAASWAWRRG